MNSCEIMVENCSLIMKGIENNTRESEVIDAMKSLANTMIYIGNIVKTYLANRGDSQRENSELQEKFLKDYSTSLKKSIIVFIQSSKDLQANPMDFLRKQDTQNSMKNVSQNIKNVISAAKGT